MSTETPPTFKPFVPDSDSPSEFTFTPLIVGTLLGIIFGASSVYLVLKVGLTVSASIPVAVLSITVFKMLSRALGLRASTILENNIAQTAGSAGESIAFAVGLVMPALLVLGFDIDVIRVMTVGVLGGLLGILMMIPLRRAFVVKKHGELKYPEGTACADVLIAGEKGGSTAKMLFFGFGIGFVFQWLMKACKLWKDEAEVHLYNETTKSGLNGAAIGSEMNPSLLGVGYIIGPRIASIMVAGGVLAYLVMVPMIKYFGDGLEQPLAPALSEMKDGKDIGLIKNMSEGQVRNKYILYIGAGAVAAGGIISMLQALPVIFASVVAGIRDMKSSGGTAGGKQLRTERDLPMSVVLFGSLGLVAALAIAPSMGLGLNITGVAGALLILLFGFLFVTVSSRLTGEIGSSSNPISGMTVATLLLTCLILLALDGLGLIELNKSIKLLALTIAGVVCVACSNGGTTSQALKTGHLVGATPLYQQYAILIGSLASAVAVGYVLLMLNQAGTVYTKLNLPPVKVNVSELTGRDTVRNGPYATDTTEYYVLVVGKREKNLDPKLFVGGAADAAKMTPGRFLVAADGTITYRCDPAVNGTLDKQDNGDKRETKYDAPKTELIALIIDGILDRNLPWNLVLLGVLIAITLELSGVPALPFAVGVYLPLSSSVPVFLGGAVRWAADKFRKSKEEGDSSPGVLLGSGYIAGAAIAQVIVAFLEFTPTILKTMDLSERVKNIGLGETKWGDSNIPAFVAFGVLIVILFIVGTERTTKRSDNT